MSKKKQEQSKSKWTERPRRKVSKSKTTDNKFEIKKIDDFQFKVFVKNITE